MFASMHALHHQVYEHLSPDVSLDQSLDTLATKTT
jgi:hypothetical protein